MNQDNPLYPIMQYAEQQEGAISDLQKQVSDRLNQIDTQQQQIQAQASQIAAQSAQILSLMNQNTSLSTALSEMQAAVPISIKAQRILGVALAHFDERTPYVFNTTWEKNKSFDCSSFTQYCYRVGAGIQLPRNKQYTYAGQEVTFDQLQPADLLFYDFPENGQPRDGVTDHVGMYLGDGKMVHTNTPTNGINIVNVATWNRSSLVKIWRILL